MAEVGRSDIVKSPYTLRELIKEAYVNAGHIGPTYSAMWNEPISRNERHRIRLDSVTQWKVRYVRNVPQREKVTTFRVRVFNMRKEPTLREYRSNYQVTILIDKLSLDAPVKVRCGGFARYKPGVSHEEMVRKGICGTFMFTFMNVLAKAKVLYGRDTTNLAPPRKTNPGLRIGFCKHLVFAVRMLLLSEFFKMMDGGKELPENVKFIKQFTW